MDKLKVLEDAVQAIHYLLLSFEFLENKSQQLIQHLQVIRNLLPHRNRDTLIPKNENETEKIANKVQIDIQSIQDALRRIRLLVNEAMIDSSENEYNSEFDLKSLQLVTYTIDLIISNCSGMKEIENLLLLGKSDTTNWSTSALLSFPGSLTPTAPSNVLSNCSKRKITNEEIIGNTGSENHSVLKEVVVDENDGSFSSKKPKPKPPMEAAVENDVVLLEIFRHCSPLDLKKFRLVNRKWNETAASTLLIKRSLEVELGFSSRGSLTDLCCLIQNSVKFPTKSLAFYYNYPELDPQVRQLLRIFGTQLKELSFSYGCKVSTSFLRELLLDLAPNLEVLHFINCAILEGEGKLFIIEEDDENSTQPNLISSLPHLKQLYFEPSDEKYNLAEPSSDYPLHMEFFKEIFNAAVNLRSVHTLPADFLEVVVDSGRAQLVKELTYEPATEKRLGDTVTVNSSVIYQKLASKKPEIETLSIMLNSFNDSQIDPDHVQKKSMSESVLNSIMESTKNSLIGLEIKPLDGFAIELPVLPKVKELIVLLTDDGNVKAVFPTSSPTFSFQKNFPHLHKLHLWLSSYIGSAIKSYFPGKPENCVNPTVKHLILQGDIFNPSGIEIDSQFEGAQMLSKMFPNVTSVVIKYVHSKLMTHQLNPILWHLCPAGVKSLSITGLHVSGPVQFIGETVDLVDSVFTGIPDEICRRLRNWTQRIGGGKDRAIFDVLRTERSICDLKNLEELNLSFNDFQSGRPQFASHVTGLYAFDLMPQLKVTFIYKPKLNRSRKNDRPLKSNKTPEDMSRSLELIAPYVTLVCHPKAY